MFDPESFAIAGVSLIAVVFGLTQFLKELLGWDGKKVTVLASLLGAIVMVSYQLIGIVPEPYGQVVKILFSSVAFGLSASGYYKYLKSGDK